MTVLAQVQVHSVWDFIVRGGPTMIPIIVLSLIALTVVIERIIMLRRRHILPGDFLPALTTILNDSPGDLRRAREFCQSRDSSIANIAGVAVKNLNRSHGELEKRVEEAGHRELVRLRKYMRLLSAIPQVATMLGLLGTIFGMIKTFQAVAASSEALGKTERLAAGIYEAWTMTAAGLLVAIPVLIAYQVLMGRIEAWGAALDRAMTDWLEQTLEPSTAAPPPGPRAEPSDSSPNNAPIAVAA